MRPEIRLLLWQPLLIVTGAQQAASLPESPLIGNVNTTAVIHNANHIFNAVQSALRQWGSSLNHNGMSAFIANIPAGTEFFHGRGDSESVRGMEWLAFEPEHAMGFARKRLKMPPPGPPPHSLSKCTVCREETAQAVLQASDQGPAPPTPSDRPRPPHGGFPSEPGWLHTYVTKHNLRLLYVDGMSAGKTLNGTLDLQDLVILASNSTQLPPMADYTRAEHLCSLVANDWDNSIQGILRMEAGFEIILCDFAANLNVRHITRVSNHAGQHHDRQVFAQWRSIMDRANDIGGRRASLNSDHFVSAYAHGLDLFMQPGAMPRLLQTTDAQRVALRDAVTALVLDDDGDGESPHDWQATADLIVTRYATRLQFLVSRDMVADQDLAAELETLLVPFIDFDARDTNAEVHRCATHFLPNTTSTDAVAPDRSTVGTTARPSLAALAIPHVSQQLCRSLFLALDVAAAWPSSARSIIRQLMDWLQWPVWKECRACAYNEVCAVPIWPWGAKEDHDSPRCSNASALGEKHGYWGGGGRGRVPPLPKEGHD